VVDDYGSIYANFASSLYAEIRRETFGDDIGQNSWLTNDELLRFVGWLNLGPETELLDIACGSGGPAIRMAQLTRSTVTGVDIQEEAITNAKVLARGEGPGERVRFERLDATRALPFPPPVVDAVVCIDAINHLPDRAYVLADWARVLKPGGRLLFTDPIVVTGPLSNGEIAARSSTGYFLFMPKGEDERLLRAAGLDLLVCEDRTENMAEVAHRWWAARARRADALRRIEGETNYEGRQEFYRVAELIARERRLSRFVYVAAKPG
jgi:ubiquinone/menaquinone biosynthesis C-methylase UbiE